MAQKRPRASIYHPNSEYHNDSVVKSSDNNKPSMKEATFTTSASASTAALFDSSRHTYTRSRGLSIDQEINKCTPFILMTHDAKKQMVLQTKSSKSVQCVRLYKIQEHIDQQCEKLHRCFGQFLDMDIIKNVVAYARTLPLGSSDIIDQSIFTAQMVRHFDLTKESFLEKMYLVCKNSTRKVHIPEYAELICIFISGNLDLKINFAFQVYLRRTDNILDGRDLDHYVKAIVEEYTYKDDEEKGCLSKFLWDLLNSYDTKCDLNLDLEEYREVVKRDPLMLQMLGPCVPDKQFSNKFKSLLEGKTPLECTAQFRFERSMSLRGPKSSITSDIQKYYPVKLELP